MKTKINQLFKSYQKAFKQFDPKAIASHYKIPCLISDVDGQQCFAKLDALTDKFAGSCNKMQEMGYIDSEFSICDIKTLSKNLVSVDMGWRTQFETEPYEFRTLYLCSFENDNWLIFSAVVYNV